MNKKVEEREGKKWKAPKEEDGELCPVCSGIGRAHGASQLCPLCEGLGLVYPYEKAKF